MARLKHIQRPSHIALTQLHQAVHSGRLYSHILGLDDLVDQRPNIRIFERTEPEPRTSRQERWRELVRVVCDDAETSISGVFLHYSAERHLRCCRHGISFVEDNKLECRECIVRSCGLDGGEDLFCACRSQYFHVKDVNSKTY